MDCSLLALLSMGILPARILEWVAMPCSRRSSQLRDQTQVSCFAIWFFTVWVTREAQRGKCRHFYEFVAWFTNLYILLFRRRADNFSSICFFLITASSKKSFCQSGILGVAYSATIHSCPSKRIWVASRYLILKALPFWWRIFLLPNVIPPLPYLMLYSAYWIGFLGFFEEGCNSSSTWRLPALKQMGRWSVYKLQKKHIVGGMWWVQIHTYSCFQFDFIWDIQVVILNMWLEFVIQGKSLEMQTWDGLAYG